MKQNSTKEIFVIALKLLAICSIVATIVAAVNFITVDKIAYNEKLNTAEALTGIYYDDYGKNFDVDGNSYVINDNGTPLIFCKQVDFEFSSKDVKALYVLENTESTTLGYCISVQPMGFKDYIKMLVAVNPDCTVKGVEIVSMSETSGIGTKAQSPEFLDKFTDLNGTEVQREVDIISGATKTSKPVIDAVTASLNEVAAYIHETGGEN